MNIKTGFKSAAFSALMLASISPASAAVVIDQSNIAVAPNGGSIIYQIYGSPINTNPPSLPPGNFITATGIQFVTAGLTGLLSAVDLQLTKYNPNNNGGQFDFIIGNNVTFDANGLLLTGNVLGTITSNISSLSATGGIVNFDTSGLGLFFNAGDQFVLALVANDPNNGVFGWSAGTSTDAPGTPFNQANFINNPYGGGDAYRGVAPANSSINEVYTRFTTTDSGFRTYVNSVPEPATWAMMIVGFGLVGGAMRRRHSVRVTYA